MSEIVDSLEVSWQQALRHELSAPYFASLSKFIQTAYQTSVVYPRPEEIFAAFSLCPITNVKVVILGQDPYHSEGQAHGLAFSVRSGVAIPPSLKNIFKEINHDVESKIPASGNLEYWARQGVLLLNSTLTVGAGKPGSHQGQGWEQFTDAVIRELSDKGERLVFLLWGNHAKNKGYLIDRQKHLVLEASHPSPLGAYKGFFGCKHFSKTNEYLQAHGLRPIVW